MTKHTVKERFIDFTYKGHDFPNMTAKDVEKLWSFIQQIRKEDRERIENKLKYMNMQDMRSGKNILTGTYAYEVPNSKYTKGYNQAIDDILDQLKNETD